MYDRVLEGLRTRDKNGVQFLRALQFCSPAGRTDVWNRLAVPAYMPCRVLGISCKSEGLWSGSHNRKWSGILRKNLQVGAQGTVLYYDYSVLVFHLCLIHNLSFLLVQCKYLTCSSYVMVVRNTLHDLYSHFINPLKPEINLNGTWKLGCCTEKTVRLHYKNKLVSAVHGSSCCLLWKSCKTLKCSLGRVQSVLMVVAGAYNFYCAFHD